MMILEYVKAAFSVDAVDYILKPFGVEGEALIIRVRDQIIRERLAADSIRLWRRKASGAGLYPADGGNAAGGAVCPSFRKAGIGKGIRDPGPIWQGGQGNGKGNFSVSGGSSCVSPCIGMHYFAERDMRARDAAAKPCAWQGREC